MRHLLLILMAAGDAKRYGENKLMVEIDGKPMFRHVLDHLVRYKDENEEDTELVVVSQFDEILNLAKDMRFTAIKNDRPQDGISKTIILSLEGREQDREEAGVFFTADQPYLTYETIRAFLDRAKVEEKGILSARSPKGMGNPVSFDKKYYAELRQLTKDQGGRLVALEHEDDTAWFEASDREMSDIDRPGEVVPKA
ncbi:MAG TPA: nucleotidyltransferase family protein [Fastidiosipila sp.]|nr:nucleotidyltransferase family protein [Fastidiosipila sp.]